MWEQCCLGRERYDETRALFAEYQLFPLEVLEENAPDRGWRRLRSRVSAFDRYALECSLAFPFGRMSVEDPLAELAVRLQFFRPEVALFEEIALSVSVYRKAPYCLLMTSNICGFGSLADEPRRVSAAERFAERHILEKVRRYGCIEISDAQMKAFIRDCAGTYVSQTFS